MTNILSGRQYIATFKIEKTGINKSVAHILLDKDKEIVECSPSCLSLLGINYAKLTKKQIYFEIQSIVPQLFQANAQNYQNKSGAQINYYYPKMTEIDQNFKPGQKGNEQNNQVQEEFNDEQEDTDKIDSSIKKQKHTFGQMPSQLDMQHEIYEDFDDSTPYTKEPLKEPAFKQLGTQYMDNKTKGEVTTYEQGKYQAEIEEVIAQYQFKAIGDENKILVFQANVTELGFDLLNKQIGYHLRLETIPEKNLGHGMNQPANQLQKKNLTKVFQFTYDPIYKRFIRELRDKQNKDHHIDKNYLSLKHLREHYKKQQIIYLQKQQQEELRLQALRLREEELNKNKKKNKNEKQDSQPIQQPEVEKPKSQIMVMANKYQNMTYMQYLKKQQRVIDKGGKNGNIKQFSDKDNDQLDEDDEMLSDEESSAGGSEKDAIQNNSSLVGNTTKGNAKDIMQMQQEADKKQDNFSNILKFQQNGDNSEYIKQFVIGEGSGKDFLKSEIERLIKILQTKQSVNEGVHTFVRLEHPNKGWDETNIQVAGLFGDRGVDVPKLDDEEENEEVTKVVDGEKGLEDSKANIKSKKAFSMAINDRTMPPSIKRLSRTAYFILCVLIAISVTEYSILYKQYSETKQNFSLIQASYLRTAELQKVAYNVRTIVLQNQKILKNTMNYTNNTAYIQSIQKGLSDSLTQIYLEQNEINLSQLPLSGEQDQLLNNKTVNLFFQQDATSMTALQFSLTESILQISSTIFTLSNMAMANFTETNEDVFFILYNSFNDFYKALNLSSQLYVLELYDRSNQKAEIGLILYFISLGALFLSIVVLIPVVYSVNKQKDKVLTLFCEIDNSCIRMLSQRCERFMNNLQSEENNDDIDSTDDLEGNAQDEDDDEYGILSGGGKKVKKPKGRTKTDFKFFLKFVIALLFIHAYFLANLLLGQNTVNVTQVLGQVLNVTSMIEPFYWLALNTQREMLFNSKKPILQSNSISIAKQQIFQLYQLNNDLQESHLINDNYLSSTYWNQFEANMRNTTCGSIPYFQNQSISSQTNSTNQTGCELFLSGILTQGLHATIIMYFEQLRSTLSKYETLLFNNSSPTQIQNILASNEMSNLLFMRNLVSTLNQSIQDEFSVLIERKIAIFICFLIVVLAAFFLFWLPFLSGLNYQIYKTKLMLMIIPLEILMKIKTVAKVLQSQSVLTGNQNNKENKKTNQKKKKKESEGDD